MEAPSPAPARPRHSQRARHGGDPRRPCAALQQLEDANLLAPDTLASIREFVARYDSGELQLEFLLAAFIGSGAA